MCAIEKITGFDFARSSFPLDFFVVVSSLEGITEMLLNHTCNVVISDRSALLNIPSSDGNSGTKFIVGDKLMTNDPLAIVTRNDDREFSDIIN